MSTKRVLITGGLGFIGWHCAQLWHRRGWNVVIVDNLSSNAVSVEQAETIAEVHDCNVVDFVYPFDFDLIIHCASPVGPVGVLKHASRMASQIIDDTMHVISLAEQSNCLLVFLSTSEIYGHRDELSQLPETGDKVLRGQYSVRNEYAIAKLLAEIVVTNRAKINPDFRYQIVRPFNVTGAYQLPDNGFCLPRFARQALAGEPLTIYFDGRQQRAFTWVQDIVDGIGLVSEASIEHLNQEWNIGNEANICSIIGLADMVRESTASNSPNLFVDPKFLHGELFTEAPEKIPDSEKIRTLLNWVPIGNIDFIVDEVVRFARQSMK